MLHVGKDYFVTVPEKDGDIYLAAETYYYGVTPLRCHPFLNLPSSLQLQIYQNEKLILDYNDYQFYNEPFLLAESDYSAGDTFKIHVDFHWGFGFEARDYTVSIYSKHQVEVLDKRGKTNMLHMDG